MLLEYLWVLLMLAGGAFWVRRDLVEYRRFVQLEDSSARQRFYGRWITQSFIILIGASLGSLWLAGALVPFDPFPQPFEPLNAIFQLPDKPVSAEMLVGIVIGISINILLLFLVQRHHLRKLKADVRQPLDPLIPRNGRESIYVLVLSINAGFSEELFFRLALPLLLYHMSGSLFFAFGFAVLCFGLVHAYQGWKGIVLTTIVGGLLTLVYLRTASLLHVMLIHMAIDVVALFVRPRVIDLAKRLLLPRRMEG